jgi:hypothetical protein
MIIWGTDPAKVTQDQKDAMRRYLRTIRRPSKRTYAVEFASFLGGFRSVEPDRPTDLCNMAAQGVRFALRDILNTEAN